MIAVSIVVSLVCMVVSLGWFGSGFTQGGIGISHGNSYPRIAESGESVVVWEGGLVSAKVSSLFVSVTGSGSGFRVGGTYNEF